MFDSKIPTKDIIEELKSEVDIAIEIPDKTYVDWLNSLEQLIYSEIIKEQREWKGMLIHENLPPTFGGQGDNVINASGTFSGNVDSDMTTIGDGLDSPRFEDIHAVYADGVQLIKTTFTSGGIFKNCFYKTGINGIVIQTEKKDPNIDIICIARPALKSVGDDSTIMLPPEFIDMAKAKLRGEAYKLANEDNLAAKWLNDYNAWLENFKAWIGSKQPQFGL